MTDLESGALALADRLATARSTGASDDEIVHLLLDSGWRPVTEAQGPVEEMDGMLRGGRTVRVRIQHRSLPNRDMRRQHAA